MNGFSISSPLPSESAPHVPVKVLMVGAGGYGRVYLHEMMTPAFDEIAELCAVVEPHPSDTPEWAWLKERGVPHFGSVDDFLRSGDKADLAVLASPISFHREQACAILEHGMNVLCEKPIAATLTDAQVMLDAERASDGEFLEIGYQWSFSRPIQALKSDILGGRLGRPIRFSTYVSWPRTSKYYSRNNWAGCIKDRQGRYVYDSPVSNATAHFLHNMLYVAGKTQASAATPIAITAECYRANPIENYDAACCWIETEENVEMLFYSAHCVHEEAGPVFRFEFEDACVEYPVQGKIVAKFHDGSSCEYGDPEVDAMGKLNRCVQRCLLPEITVSLCGPKAAMSHTLCVDALQRVPVYEFEAESLRVRSMGRVGELTYFPGMLEGILNGYENKLLFSELGLGWSSRATRVEL